MKEVLLIDLGSVYWAAWHSSVNDEVSMAHDRCVEHVRKLAGDCKAVAVCCDSPKSIRREKHPEYKAQRPEKDHASIEQLHRVKETLRKDGFLLWEHEGYEADDVIASAVNKTPSGVDVLIASADKDLLQLVIDASGDANEMGRVRVVSTSSGTVCDEAGVREKLGVGPGMVRDWLALVGDKSDNVAGVPGIGAVKAAALLNAFGSIEETLRRLQTNVTHELFKPALSAALRDPENLKRLAVAQELVTLFDSLPVRFEEVFEERQVQPLKPVADADFAEVDEEPASAQPQALAVTAPPPADPDAATGGLVAAPVAHTPIVMTYEQQLQPTSLKAAWTLAGHLHNSRLYSRFQTQEAIFAIIIRGREMGLTALTALDQFHMIEGKPSPGAHLLIARAKQHPDCEYFRYIGGDDTYAEYETKSRQNDAPTRLKYTIEDARRAGLAPEKPRLRPEGGGEKDKRNQWEKRPAEMLRKTCAVQLLRIEYPEALGGLYAQEELAA